MKTVRNKISLLFLSIMLIVTSFSFINAKPAATNLNSDILTQLSITDENGNPLLSSLSQWDKFRINASFSIPNNMFSEGDVTTIKLPDRLKFANELSFPIKNHAGDIIAYAEIHSNTKTITLTYTNFVSSNSDVSGSFYFLTSVDSNVVKEDGTVPLELDIDGKLVFVCDIEYEIDVPKESEFDKSGWFDDGSNRIVRYALDISKSKKIYTNAIVKDSLSTTGAKINIDSIRI